MLKKLQQQLPRPALVLLVQLCFSAIMLTLDCLLAMFHTAGALDAVGSLSAPMAHCMQLPGPAQPQQPARATRLPQAARAFPLPRRRCDPPAIPPVPMHTTSHPAGPQSNTHIPHLQQTPAPAPAPVGLSAPAGLGAPIVASPANCMSQVIPAAHSAIPAAWSHDPPINMQGGVGQRSHCT